VVPSRDPFNVAIFSGRTRFAPSVAGIGEVASGGRATARVVNASSSDGAVDQHVARSSLSDSQ